MSFNVDVSGREHLENWRPIPGFEGYYEASNLGRVRGLDRLVPNKFGTLIQIKGRMLKQRQLPHGYIIVMLCKNNQYQNRLVHRLVLSAFHGIPEDGVEACHNNGIRSDNRLENLRWDTHSANSHDQLRHGTHRNKRKTHCHRGHLFDKANTYVRPNGGRLCRACKRKYDNQRYHAKNKRLPDPKVA